MAMSEPIVNPEPPEGAGDELRQPGPIEAAFLWALDGLEDFSRAALLDEESLTASFLGGLRVAVPAAAKQFGSGILEKTRRCSWAAFNKSGRATDERSEAASGADFGLVLWESETHARLCIFQAKKVKTGGHGEAFDIHRSPPKPSVRRPQLVMLAATGLRCLKALEAAHMHPTSLDPGAPPIADRDVIAEFLTDSSSQARMDVIKALDWIQYLVYRKDAPICVPLSEIPANAIDREFALGASKTNYVDIGFGSGTLRELVLSGLSDANPKAGWPRVDRHTLETLLPDLLDLMQVYVASGRSGGLVNSADARVEVVAQPSSPGQMVSLQAEVAARAPPSSRAGMSL